MISTPIEDGRTIRQTLFGENVIDIQISWFKIVFLFFKEVLQPFYFFQVTAILIWFLDNYYIYAMCVMVTSLISALYSCYITVSNLIDLANKYGDASNRKITRILSDGSKKSILICELVPGDVYLLNDLKNRPIPADSVLLKGSCSVNESMITGEAISKGKDAATSEELARNDFDVSQVYMLIGGTKINSIESNSDVTAIVVKSGWNTEKAKFVLMKLFPKENALEFEKDSMYFVLMMLFFGFIGVCFSLSILIYRNLPPWKIFIKSLDVITIAVPPALPIAIAMGQASSLIRLKDKKISCISPSHVNQSGTLDIMCFDKTGTLTQDKVILKGIRTVQSHQYQPEIMFDQIQQKANPQVVDVLSACHSLIPGSELSGDPLEFEMIKSTKRHVSKDVTCDKVLIHDSQVGVKLIIEYKWAFQSQTKKMTVIAKNPLENHYQILVKGAPSVVVALCDPKTVPDDNTSVLVTYEKKGYRVLACATKNVVIENLDITNLDRDALEANMDYQGLIFFENPLKRDINGIMGELNSSGMHTVMITGDSSLTAVAVAEDCHLYRNETPIICTKNSSDRYIWKTCMSDRLINDPLSGKYILVITGDIFGELDKVIESIQSKQSFDAKKLRFLKSCKVFARMLPEQKQKVIEEYKRLDWYVGMVGDGANDCHALKTAHAGLSLSKAEASIAAPFSSNEIMSVLELLKEGRASLIGSIQVFKFMLAYSFVTFLTVVTLYWTNTNFADFQFLFMDIFIVLPVAFLSGESSANEELSVAKPQNKLFHILTVVSILMQVAITYLFTLGVQLHYKYVGTKWFIPNNPDYHTNFSYETTCAFLLNQIMLTNLSLTFNVTDLFKGPIYSNTLYCLYLGCLYMFSFYLVMNPHEWLMDLLEMKPIPFHYKLGLLGYGVIHLIVTWNFERILQWLWYTKGFGRKGWEKLDIEEAPVLTTFMSHDDLTSIVHDDMTTPMEEKIKVIN